MPRRPAEHRRWGHSPRHHGQLAVAVSGSHHPSRVVREYTGHGRQVADVVVHRAEQCDDGGLVGRDRIQIAHSPDPRKTPVGPRRGEVRETVETYWAGLMMSVDRRRSEVAGRRPKRR
jgi:hypothetical protein